MSEQFFEVSFIFAPKTNIIFNPLWMKRSKIEQIIFEDLSLLQNELLI